MLIWQLCVFLSSPLASENTGRPFYIMQKLPKASCKEDEKEDRSKATFFFASSTNGTGWNPLIKCKMQDYY
jgi:hypothetical protein